MFSWVSVCWTVVGPLYSFASDKENKMKNLLLSFLFYIFVNLIYKADFKSSWTTRRCFRQSTQPGPRARMEKKKIQTIIVYFVDKGVNILRLFLLQLFWAKYMQLFFFGFCLISCSEILHHLLQTPSPFLCFFFLWRFWNVNCIFIILS